MSQTSRHNLNSNTGLQARNPQAKETQDRNPSRVPTAAGIDVGKRWLDAHIGPSGEARRFANDQLGRRALGTWLRRHGVQRTASSPPALPAPAASGLGTLGCETVLVRPDCARRFSEALGQLVRTDCVDAAMLAHYRRLEGLAATAPLEAAQTVLQDLVQLRTRCVGERAAYGKLVAELESSEARRQARLHLQALDRRVTALNAALEAALAADPALQRRAEILRLMPSLGLEKGTGCGHGIGPRRVYFSLKAALPDGDRHHGTLGATIRQLP